MRNLTNGKFTVLLLVGALVGLLLFVLACSSSDSAAAPSAPQSAAPAAAAASASGGPGAPVAPAKAAAAEKAAAPALGSVRNTPVPQPTRAVGADPVKVVPASWTDGHPRGSTRVGGTVKAMVPAGLAHHDMHQSVTFNNMGPQIPMYNGLLYFNPDEYGVFTPGADLAKGWTLSGDGLSYDFDLQTGVRFHDGSAFDADDVVATMDKILNPKEGVLSMRKIAFDAVDSVTKVDPLTVRFNLNREDGILPKSIAIGFNVMVSKDTLEELDYDLRPAFDAPGTGPFKYMNHKQKEVWNLEKNADYFKDGLPYLDRLKIFHGTGAAAAAALLSGQVDYSAWLNKGDGDKIVAGDFPGYKSMTWGVYNNTAIWFNSNRKPFDDERVRRAIFLAVDPHVMLALWNSTRLGDFGEWVPPQSLGGTYSRSLEELAETPGWRTPTAEDVQEAKDLMAAAGYGEGSQIQFLARGSVSSQVEGMAQILEETFGIESELSVSDAGVYYDKVWSGDWDITRATWTNMFGDPCEIWRNVLRADSPQNYGNFQDDRVDVAVNEVCRLPDGPERAESISKSVQLLDEIVPTMVLDWPIGQNAWNDETFELNPQAWTTNYWNHNIWEISALK